MGAFVTQQTRPNKREQMRINHWVKVHKLLRESRSEGNDSDKSFDSTFVRVKGISMRKGQDARNGFEGKDSSILQKCIRFTTSSARDQ